MAIKRLNHAVLYVRSVNESVLFYTEQLGFKVKFQMPGAAFMSLPGGSNDHDLGLFEVGADAQQSTAGRGSVGLYHLAWEVETLGELQKFAERLGAIGSLIGATDHGTTKALYARDPSGLEFELSWLVPIEVMTAAEREVMQTEALDLDKEIARYGADTPGLQTVLY